MRIGIFGGTFNPIHIGHLVSAQVVQEKLKLDEVIFVPSYLPPHKSSKNVIKADDRYRMVQLAVKGNSHFKISDFEVKRKVKSYSIETVNYLTTQFSKETKFFFIVGEDSLAGLSSWKCIDELLTKVTFAVVHRPGYSDFSSKIQVRSVPMSGLDISSSEIRRKVQKGESIKYFVSEDVFQYIEKNNLYRGSWVMSKKVNQEIKFGTDGWRGIISDNFTFKNVEFVAQAISEWIKKDFKVKAGKKNIVAIGYDARFLSQEYAELVSCVLVANNIKVYLSDDMVPTPSLSYGVVHLKGVAGVMITASHNPAKFNGIKIKTYEGGGASNDITDKVEAYLEKTTVKKIDFLQAKKEKKIIMHDFDDAYLKFMKDYVDLKKIRQSKFKVIQDVMYGSGGGVLEAVLKGSKIDLEYMHNSINPSFGGVKPEPVPEYLKGILNRMKKEDFDLGLVLDGDADRIAAIAPGGEYISPQKILGLLILHLARNRGCKGGVVKTTCGTELIDNIAKKLDLKLYETPVGFKYISDLMVSEEIIAGGEEAGGMGVQGYIPERDGNLAGLLLLEMMVYQKKNIKQILQDMEKEFGRYYYERADLELGSSKFDAKRTAAVKTLLGKKVVDVKTFDGVKLICEDRSWLMLRPSGTEPLVRAYSEAKSLKKAKQLIECGKKLLR